MGTDNTLGSKDTTSGGLSFESKDRATKKLVKEAMRGNPEAISKVIGLYYKDIFYFATKKVGYQDAEDVSQQAISEIINDFESLKDPVKVRSWMMRIVRNSCVDYMRRNRLTTKLFSSIDQDEEVSFEPKEESYELIPEAAFDTRETRDQVTACIDTLPDNYAEALRLYYLEELNYDEIAEVLQIQRRKVKNDLYNARILFKKHFEENTGVQMRLAVAPAAAVPFLTQILQEECSQLATPALLERMASFTDTTLAAKFGTASLGAGISGSATAGISGAAIAKGIAIAVGCLAAAGITINLVAGGIEGEATPEPAPAPVEVEAESQPSTTETLMPIETLADMIGESEAATLESFVQTGVDEATWQAFFV